MKMVRDTAYQTPEDLAAPTRRNLPMLPTRRDFVRLLNVLRGN